MNVTELQRALRQLRLGGMAAVLETRLLQAQSEAMAPIDLVSCLVSDELKLSRSRTHARQRPGHPRRQAGPSSQHQPPSAAMAWETTWIPSLPSTQRRDRPSVRR